MCGRWSWARHASNQKLDILLLSWHVGCGCHVWLSSHIFDMAGASQHAIGAWPSVFISLLNSCLASGT